MSSVAAWRPLRPPGAGWQPCSGGGSPGAGLWGAPGSRPSLSPLGCAPSNPTRPLRLGIQPRHILRCSGKSPCPNTPQPALVSLSACWGVTCVCAQGGRGHSAERPRFARQPGWGTHGGVASPPSSRGLQQVPGPPSPAPPGSPSPAGWGASGRLWRGGARCGVLVLLSPSLRDTSSPMQRQLRLRGRTNEAHGDLGILLPCCWFTQQSRGVEDALSSACCDSLRHSSENLSRHFLEPNEF